MTQFCNLILLLVVSVSSHATRGPHCSEYGGCGGGMPEWLEWTLFIGLFALIIRGAYKSNGFEGVIPILLWLTGMPLSVYLASLGYIPLWSALVVFTGVWWFDPFLRKVGLRKTDFEP
jgi:hypothetical protein